MNFKYKLAINFKLEFVSDSLDEIYEYMKCQSYAEGTSFQIYEFKEDEGYIIDRFGRF